MTNHCTKINTDKEKICTPLLLNTIDVIDGVLYWNENASQRGARKKGLPVEFSKYPQNDYYRLDVRVDGKPYTLNAHRLVWFMNHGEWPKTSLDHIDEDKSNNTIENLRIATPSQNQAARTNIKQSSTGYRGVSANPNGTYKAYLISNNTYTHLGVFSCPTIAAIERDKVVLKEYGEFAVLNFPELRKEHENG